MAITERLPRPVGAEAALAAAGFALGIVVVVAGNYHVQKGENGGTGPALVTSIICLVLAAGLFGYVVPRARALDRTAMILGYVGLVSIVAFWSGVTPILAAASVAVARRSSSVPRKVVVAESLALLAAAVAVIGTLAQSHLF